MLKILIVAALFFFPILSFSQACKEWDDHDVIRFYNKIELDSLSLDKDGEDIDEVYVPTEVDDGLYEVEVHKVSSKLYLIREGNIYMLFRYPPYLTNYDEGILEVSYNSGTFYKKP